MRRALFLIVVSVGGFFPSTAHADNEPCKEGNCSGGDCRDTSAECQDNDFNSNDITVCLPESTCNFGGGE